MKYLIDTNVFLHAALSQDRESECVNFLDSVSSGDIEAAVSLFHLDAAAMIMENRGVPGEDIGNFYFEAYSSEGLEVVNLGVSTRLNAVASEKHSGLDDSLLYEGSRELEVDKIVSYDNDFKEAITPEEVLKNTT